MESSPNSAASSAAPTFAGLLAGFAGVGSSAAPPWNDDRLANDSVTLSYERALRNHARYRPPSPPEEPAAAPYAQPRDVPRPAAPASSRPAFLRELKCASITIRLSEAECAQLRTRAADAGLTVSAYLRSCTFEAESLRALVKDTMAQLRSASVAKPSPVQPVRRSWLARLLAWWQRGRLTPSRLAAPGT